MNKAYLPLILIILTTLLYLTIKSVNKNYYSEFEKIPIFYDGKIKTLDSFSKSIFNELELKDKKKKNIELLADLLLNFEEFSESKILKIKNKNLIKNLDLEENKEYTYSFNEILISVKKNYKIIHLLKRIDYDNRTTEQNELLKIYDKVLYIISIKNYFYQTNEKEKNNTQTFYIIPQSENTWLSYNNLENKNNEIIKLINEITLNYKNKNMQIWKDKCKLLKENSEKKISKYTKFKLKIELIYNKFNLIYLSFILYAIVLIYNATTYIIKKIHIKKNTNIQLTLLIISLIFNICEIILRIIISERAPITNLYESIVFVNSTITLLYLIFYYKLKFNILFIIFITTLQYIAYKYSIDGTNIKNLVPVLDTNFWLILHVITITLGYSLCLMSGLLAHLYLYLRIDLKKNELILKNLFYLIHIFIIIALLFSFCGTILGGIWANQSWGRFWGWDPKENGAMLIVLWLTFIIHLRMIKFSNALLYINGIIINNIMVFLAWFGVNLLNVGLHSYGFTKNIGFSLVILIIFESSYIITFYSILNKNKIKIKNL